jgi:UDP-N-acetylmuramoyl-L-alanyl-D-glutamate--2,6-diaminopimelate ligase
MEDYFKSKLELFNRCKIGIINVDDEYGKMIKSIAPCNIRTCSMSKDADYFVDEINSFDEKGTVFKMRGENKELLLKNNVPGRFSIMNSMQACACALELNIDKEKIERSFESFHGVRGRLERIEVFKGEKITVFIDYAHTPDALYKLLETVNGIKGCDARSILVFGCGGDRERQKRSIMGSIASQYADISIITSDNPRSEDPDRIIDDILLGISDRKNIKVIPKRREAIEYAIEIAKKNDIVILAGKGHEDYQINDKGRVHFDEREVLLDIERNYRRK